MKNETKIALKANTFTSVKEAIKKINENLVIIHFVCQRYNNRGRAWFGDQRGNYRGRYKNFRGPWTK